MAKYSKIWSKSKKNPSYLPCFMEYLDRFCHVPRDQCPLEFTVATMGQVLKLGQRSRSFVGQNAQNRGKYGKNQQKMVHIFLV